LKRVLITGANSYVGTNVEKWLMKEPENFYVETLDMRDPNWKNFDFSKFDVVFHVAGIAHVSTKKSMKDLYFKVNRDLTIETAIKAKESGVEQFIFMSSMIVYNSKETRITKETKPNPDNFYGLSKLQAEEGIFPLQSDTFNVVVLRPPMIYGPGSKGNFSKLVKLSKRLLIIPNYLNKRSSLYIMNLCIFIKEYVETEVHGLFFPQNNEYYSLVAVIEYSRKFQHKKCLKLSLFNQIIGFMVNRIRIMKKILGDFYYDNQLITNNDLVTLKDSLESTLRSMIENE